MDAVQPRHRAVRRDCAPKTFPCPHCGKHGRRRKVHTRQVRDIAYREIVIIKLRVGEYRARCSCCKTFRAQVEGIDARAQYTNQVREAVIDRLLDDSMSMERIRQALLRDFHLELSDGFLYDCIDWKVRQLDMKDYRQWTLQQFSGTLCIDEIHLGKKTLLLATDPINDFPVAFALVSNNDQGHMGRFLRNLKNLGFNPQVVVTDRSNLYPKLLAEIWPEARQQLCIFHVLQDINKHVFDALRRLRRQLARQPKRKRRRRGRPTKAQQRAHARAGKSKREQAHFVWKHRYLLVTRPDELSGHDRLHLSRLFRYLPAARRLRDFVLQVYRLFNPKLTVHQARCRRAALVKTEKYLADPDLAKALAILKAADFNKMIAYLHSPAHEQVRTNNHVERTNRRMRYFEKVRYKWRRRRTIVRFVVLAFSRWQQRQQRQAAAKTASESAHRQRVRVKIPA